jgi:ribonuclease G
MQAAPEAEASSVPSETAEAAPVSAVSAISPAPGSEPSGERRPPEAREERERRGRRSRRRRRGGGHGFPESKYASEGTPGPQSIESSQPEAAQSEPAIEVAEQSAPPVGHHFTEAVPIVLPGESLAKYRNAPPPPDPEPTVAEIELEDTQNEYDEPVHYLPENALPDAPLHALPSETELESPATSEEPIVTAAIEAEPAEFLPETLESAEVSEHLAGESEDEPAVAPLLDDDEDSDIQAMILGDVEGIEISPPQEGAEAGESGEAATAESGSASVRERGGRFPHRVSRRRRRGRPQGPPGERREPGAAEAPRNELNANGAESNGSAPREDQPHQERGERPERSDRAERERPDRERMVSRPNQGQPSISDLLKEGQEIIVQIAKEPLGPKGARITSHIALPGRYVVYMPTLEHMGVSRKIASDEERLRLKRILQGKRPGPVGGFITRTAAEGRTEDEIAGDMLFLYNLWQDIRTKADKRPAPVMLHHDLDIVQRILRDQLADSFKAIWIDNEETYENVLRFVERFQPALVPKVKLYTRDAPIFDAFNVTNELEKALRPKVWLKSGGFIVINQTEALVAIDVNTGKYVGKTNRLEDTIVKTNTEAIKEIVRQIRLRDLGGIIVIDFIDMDERKNRQKVMQTLEEAMRVDRAPYKILQFNDFGLVAITRKRVKQSLERTLCAPCPHCEGAGYVKSPQTVVSEILTEARKLSRSIEGKDVMLRVHPDVAKVLKSHQNKFLEELEEMLRRPVLVKSDPQLHHEKFDLA